MHRVRDWLPQLTGILLASFLIFVHARLMIQWKRAPATSPLEQTELNNQVDEPRGHPRGVLVVSETQPEPGEAGSERMARIAEALAGPLDAGLWQPVRFAWWEGRAPSNASEKDVGGDVHPLAALSRAGVELISQHAIRQLTRSLADPTKLSRELLDSLQGAIPAICFVEDSGRRHVGPAGHVLPSAAEVVGPVMSAAGCSVIIVRGEGTELPRTSSIRLRRELRALSLATGILFISRKDMEGAMQALRERAKFGPLAQSALPHAAVDEGPPDPLSLRLPFDLESGIAQAERGKNYASRTLRFLETARHLLRGALAERREGEGTSARLPNDVHVTDKINQRPAGNIIWQREWWNGLAEEPDIAVICAVLPEDVRFARSYLEDVLSQEALGRYLVEVVFGTVDSMTSGVMAREVARSGVPAVTAAVRILQFEADPGLYAMWDFLIKNASRAPLITNWNLDDRKSPVSLQRRAETLMEVGADIVTAKVYMFPEEDDHFTWQALRKSQVFQFELGSSRFLRMCDMIELDKGHKGRLIVAGSRNIPHNSPMWRRSLHQFAGPFSVNGLQSGCMDYSLWLRALYYGASIYHLDESLEMFMVRKSSHGHRSHLPRRSKFVSVRSLGEGNGNPTLRQSVAAFAVLVTGLVQ